MMLSRLLTAVCGGLLLLWCVAGTVFAQPTHTAIELHPHSSPQIDATITTSITSPVMLRTNGRPLSIEIEAQTVDDTHQPHQTAVGPDPRFILHTNAGLSAYITTTAPLALDFVRPLFTEIETETADYIHGRYKLAGRNIEVGLIAGRDGWILAYHDQGIHVGRLFSCLEGGYAKSRVQFAIEEIKSAIGSNAPLRYYDFRHPTADRVVMHWGGLSGYGTAESSITLPLTNTYLERAYFHCSSINSELWLNGERIQSIDPPLQVVYRYGLLDSNQLRAGQTNNLRLEGSLSIFGGGVFGGVAALYEGEAPVPIAGNNLRRDIRLTYPAVLGEPVEIYRQHLPLVVSAP